MISGFNWIIENKIAGSGMPGVYEDREMGLEFVKKKRFTHIVSLVEENPEHVFEDLDILHRHFSITDMGVPDTHTLKNLLKEMSMWIDEGAIILVHCKAGLGRTGLVLACYLVYGGMAANLAIEFIRKINPSYIQNSLQERFVKLFGLMN